MPCREELEEIFRQAIDALPDGVVIFDAERRFVTCNRRYREMYFPAVEGWASGVDFEQAAYDVARHCVGLSEGAALEAWVTERVREVTGGGRWAEQRLKDGRWIRLSDAALPNGWTVGIRTDITRTKTTEEAADALRASEARLRDFADSASDWFWETDTELRVHYLSRRFTEVTGVPEETMLGRTRHEAMVADADPAAREALLEALAERRPFRGFVHPRKQSDGEVRWFSINGRPIFGSAGEFLGYRGTGSDVTERERAKLELIEAKEASEQATRSKSEFLANVSHEIRTPMNGVLGMLELLQASELTSQQREYVEAALSCAGDLLTLLNDVLDLSKIEAGKLELEQVDMDVTALVEGVCELHAERAHRKGLEIAAVVAPAVPATVRGDPTRLRQVLSNLVSNAIKFTEYGEVAVYVEREAPLVGARAQPGARLRFEVRDTGIGITPDVQHRIFDSFTQADGTTTRRYGGTGLGLSISRHIVEHMGGQLAVTSSPGAGSNFHFSADFALPCEPAAEPPLPAFPGARVLIVDDTETNRLVLERRLEHLQVRFSSADQADTALATLREAAEQGAGFDMVLLDAMMPEVDGFALAAAIRSEPPLARTPLVMLTSLTAFGVEKRAREAGVDRLLTKPVRQVHLQQCLVEMLEFRERSRAYPPGVLGPTPAAATHRPGAGHVLLVEDNRVNQVVALSMLRKLGYRADVVSDGAQALRALEGERYDLVLMDCQMPVLDGYAATRRIRAAPTPYRDIPVVALTASAMAEDAQKCYESGMTDFLSKPMTMDALARKLQRWLGEAASDQEPAARNES